MGMKDDDRAAERLVELRAETARLLEELDRQIGAVEEAQVTEISAERAEARATGDPMLVGLSNRATSTTYLDCTAPNADSLYVTGASGVTAAGNDGPGLRGYGTNAEGVVGSGPTGVRGSGNQFGVVGESSGSGTGVQGRSRTGDALYGLTYQGRGAVAVSLDNYGVQAFSRNRSAVLAQSIAGAGVISYTTSGADPAVLAENDSGVADSTALLVFGHAGVGAYLSGDRAPLRLALAQASGAPTSGDHLAGEIYLDSNADLFLCKASGSPGTWAQIA
jgi:hypothetical protein